LQTVSPTGSAVSPNESGLIPVFLLQLKKDGFADATIRCYGSDLRILSKNCELSNPESVKEWIANAKLSTTRKWSFVSPRIRILSCLRAIERPEGQGPQSAKRKRAKRLSGKRLSCHRA